MSINKKETWDLIDIKSELEAVLEKLNEFIVINGYDESESV